MSALLLAAAIGVSFFFTGLIFASMMPWWGNVLFCVFVGFAAGYFGCINDQKP